jgi:hypothetical protein
MEPPLKKKKIEFTDSRNSFKKVKLINNSEQVKTDCQAKRLYTRRNGLGNIYELKNIDD